MNRPRVRWIMSGYNSSGHTSFNLQVIMQRLNRGYYRKAGLDVELIEAQPDINPVDAVVKGDAEFGSGDIESYSRTRPRQAGRRAWRDLPTLAIDAFGPGAMRGISDIEDLVGRPIMIEPEEQDIFAYFKNEGLDPAKLKVLPQSFNLKDFTDGKIDAMTAYSTDEPYRFARHGCPFSPVQPAGGVAWIFTATISSRTRRRYAIIRIACGPFARRVFRGWSYALAHEEEIVDLIERKYNRGRTKPQLLFEAQQTERLMHPI